MTGESQIALELKGITKFFPGVTALDRMSIQLRPGEVHGLIGENGAGKSTLIKIMTGLYHPDDGEIFVHGQPMVFATPLAAKRQGISCVYQELNIIKEMSVVDNLFVGNYKKKKNGFLDKAAMRKRAVEIMSSIGSSVDPDTPCSKLGMGQQQMIEIGKSILAEADVVILDEPTSSLGKQEAAQLMKTVRILKEQGKAILFVSHKLEEIFELCDVVTVMRDGKHIITAATKDLTRDSLITHMVGREVTNLYPKRDTPVGEVILEVRNIRRKGQYRSISFEARRGELLGFAGLVGAGRTEVFRGVFAADPIDGGEILINGRFCRIKSPKQAVEAGMALLPEDRKTQGLILGESIWFNTVLVALKRMCRNGFLNYKQIRLNADQEIDRLQIRTTSAGKNVSELSGGNQQKVVVSKWLESDADIYIFDEPTRGIDVGAKAEIYEIMGDLLEQGKCVIMISSELPEILGMCDRVIVMRNGQITANIRRDSVHFNQQDIMDAAWGRSLEE